MWTLASWAPSVSPVQHACRERSPVGRAAAGRCPNLHHSDGVLVARQSSWRNDSHQLGLPLLLAPETG